eukprot:Lithocolla_globosa_v1_NODE_4744_length_1376_cov_22.244512.p1 type:complete len:102 gc:universal NODE_4744_length_1376_cov_22.244512:782-1087(+)
MQVTYVTCNFTPKQILSHSLIYVIFFCLNDANTLITSAEDEFEMTVCLQLFPFKIFFNFNLHIAVKKITYLSNHWGNEVKSFRFFSSGHRTKNFFQQRKIR